MQSTKHATDKLDIVFSTQDDKHRIVLLFLCLIGLGKFNQYFGLFVEVLRFEGDLGSVATRARG